MTNFTDGPAAGKTLELLRMPMPKYLRVVRDPDGNIDALDQLDDKPDDNEELFVYVMTENHGTVHVDGRDKKGKRFGKLYESCTYAMVKVQPSQETLRGKDSWPAWCMAEHAREKGAKDGV